MNIRVLFFGATADIAEKRQVDLVYDGPTSVDDVLARLSHDFPAFRTHRLLIAVNQEYVGEKHVLETGDEVAVFTPVSGG